MHARIIGKVLIGIDAKDGMVAIKDGRSDLAEREDLVIVWKFSVSWG
jgi:hypothetical protein